MSRGIRTDPCRFAHTERKGWSHEVSPADLLTKIEIPGALSP
jgi:hypothetical protein